MTLPGADEGGDWHAQPQDKDPVQDPSVTVEPAADGVELQHERRGRHRPAVTTAAETSWSPSFAAPDGVPVALSEDLADAIDAKVGEVLEAELGDTRLPLEVVAVVPDVPSAPGGRRCSPTSTPSRAA